MPSLIIPDRDLLAGEHAHVGTLDLDLGLSVAVLHEQLYEKIAQRLREAGLAPDLNDAGNPTAQRWQSSRGVRIDFLIPPTLPLDRGGSLRHLDKELAAFIIPGLDLAFADSELVTIDDELPDGGLATRQIRVCGPAAFTVLKALAFGNRGKPKDAYDLYYVLRHHTLGATAIGTRLSGLGSHPAIDEACMILRRDFLAADLVGSLRVAEFLGGPGDAITADSAGFVRQALDGYARGDSTRTHS